LPRGKSCPGGVIGACDTVVGIDYITRAEVENLYVAGSAVFPTVGWANPNLTILALAIRLAEKLQATRWSSPA